MDLVQALHRKLPVELVPRIQCTHHQLRPMRNVDANRSSAGRGRLHEPKHGVQQSALQYQRRKQCQQRHDNQSREPKHDFHRCSPNLRRAEQLTAEDNRRPEARVKSLKIGLLHAQGRPFAWAVAHSVYALPRGVLLARPKFSG